ncbi:MAG: ankyrin repeat domain-containing protein [Puniceicoccales bacterium]|jgi:ankyrin repeat protein|nr:ankyrin repeat domain-containing protein [Puniceicoccales bacterium]
MMEASRVSIMPFLVYFLCFSEVKAKIIIAPFGDQNHGTEQVTLTESSPKENTYQSPGSDLAIPDYRVSRWDKSTQKAWWRCIHILQHGPCKGDDETFQLLNSLLEQHPALLQLADDRGQTLLFHAINWRQTDVIAHLLSLGCPYDCQDRKHNTALLLAIKKEFTEAVVLLLAYGADPYICNGRGFNAYQLACTLKHPNIIAILLRMAPIKSDDLTQRIESI